MGSDIHLMVEYDDSKRKRPWRLAGLPDRICHPAPFADTKYIRAFAEGELLIPRHYALFEALAGVRADEGFVPLIAPRGFPEIASRDVINRFFYYVLDGVEGVEAPRERDIPREEAESYVARGVSFYRDHPRKPRGEVSNPEWHTLSWLTLGEATAALAHAKLDPADTPDEFQLTLDLLRGLERFFGVGRARVVFWFDN
jgi:hypothetical protein